ncbi:MAG: hypothetical protein QOH49_4898 [Acidobacteriota bacterium]|jgi:hypothetical protein|nr:hypothetical protein [Acidobacteriota bacterium]
MSVAEHARRRGERGGSRFNFVVVVLLIGLAAYSAYNYAPVAYNAYLYKDLMRETVNKAAYPPAKGNDWIAQQLRAAAKEYGVPDNADIKVQNEDGRIAAHVTWTRPIQLPGYVYEYNFDHTARSSGFIK